MWNWVLGFACVAVAAGLVWIVSRARVTDRWLVDLLFFLLF
jgi:hypothetical protein